MTRNTLGRLAHDALAALGFLLSVFAVVALISFLLAFAGFAVRLAWHAFEWGLRGLPL